MGASVRRARFLSIQAQDFIEELGGGSSAAPKAFLSIQAQDFIEEMRLKPPRLKSQIPEHSSSGLH